LNRSSIEGGKIQKKQAPTGVSACKQAFQRFENWGARRAEPPCGRSDVINGLLLAACAATAKDAEKPPAVKNKHPPE
jgi:hypothetical protein